MIPAGVRGSEDLLKSHVSQKVFQSFGPCWKHRCNDLSFQTIENRDWEGFTMNMLILPRIGILAGNI